MGQKPEFESIQSSAEEVFGYSSGERASSSERRRPVAGRKRGKTPQSVNGIHRRRRRKMSW